MITKSSLNTMLTMGLLMLLAAVLFLPVDAFAASTNTSTDILQQSKDLSKQIVIIPRLIAVGAYVIGAFFAVRALFALKGFIEAPDDNPLTKVLGFAAVSALLIMLPYIMAIMQNSITSNSTTGNVTSAESQFTEKQLQ